MYDNIEYKLLVDELSKYKKAIFQLVNNWKSLPQISVTVLEIIRLVNHFSLKAESAIFFTIIQLILSGIHTSFGQLSS